MDATRTDEANQTNGRMNIKNIKTCKQTKKQPFFSVSLPQIATKIHKKKHWGGVATLPANAAPISNCCTQTKCRMRQPEKTGVDTHTNKPKNETKSQKVDRKIGKNGEKEVDVNECVSAALKRAGEGTDVNIEIKQRQLQLSLSLQLEICKKATHKRK